MFEGESLLHRVRCSFSFTVRRTLGIAPNVSNAPRLLARYYLDVLYPYERQ